MSADRGFRQFWFAWLLVLAVVEGIALLRRSTGDTLSGFVWLKVTILPMRIALGATLIWLVYHWLFAVPGRAIGWRDAASVVLGAVLGVLAWLQAKRRKPKA